MLIRNIDNFPVNTSVINYILLLAKVIVRHEEGSNQSGSILSHISITLDEDGVADNFRYGTEDHNILITVRHSVDKTYYYRVFVQSPT